MDLSNLCLPFTVVILEKCIYDITTISQVFVELFPEKAAESRKILEQRRIAQEEKAKGKGQSSLLSPSDPLARQRRGADNGTGLQGALTNFLVLGGFAAFAFVVQYVVQNIATADP